MMRELPPWASAPACAGMLAATLVACVRKLHVAGISRVPDVYHYPPVIIVK